MDTRFRWGRSTAGGDQDMPYEEGGPDSAPWLPDFSARLVETLEDTVQAGVTAADRWARRSLEDGEWSVDTVTAEVIADWEEMTPLLGRWLDLWLEALQRGIGEAGPANDVTLVNAVNFDDAVNREHKVNPENRGHGVNADSPTQEVKTEDADSAPGGPPDVNRLMRRRFEEYVRLWEDAATKLRHSSYRSEHLLDDWFTFWGKAVRDMTAGSALLWRAAVGTTAGDRDRHTDGRPDGAVQR